VKSEARLVGMVAGWILAFYGVRRRSWPGTMIAMLALGLAQASMSIGGGEPGCVRPDGS